MNNKQIHWFEAKQLDRVTNFSTEIEVIKTAIQLKVPVKYYCTFKSKKVYFGLTENIFYLGKSKNRYLKAVEFQALVVLKSLALAIFHSNNVIIVNQDLVHHVLPARFFSRLFGKRNRFVIDIRTTPTNPDTFERDMKRFHKWFGKAVKYFDGLSFITPFMEKFLMQDYVKKLPTVHWSSGVDMQLFDRKLYGEPKNNGFFSIFYHGGISESRGNLDLIKACELLVEKGYKIQLIQIGICVDKSIPDYINFREIGQWCKLLPPVALEEIPEIVAAVDLPVLPFPNFMAWRVSSPIKLMEYLAMGKKVLAPNMEAFTDVFQDHPELVFYFNSLAADRVAEISTKISEIIDNNFLGNVDQDKCIDFVKDRYTWNAQTSQLVEFCISL